MGAVRKSLVADGAAAVTLLPPPQSCVRENRQQSQSLQVWLLGKVVLKSRGAENFLVGHQSPLRTLWLGRDEYSLLWAERKGTGAV